MAQRVPAVQLEVEGGELTADEWNEVATTVTDNALDAEPRLTSIETYGLAASDKGVPNGVAPLDGSGKMPSSYLTVGVMVYKGDYDAALNVPDLTSPYGGTVGDVYIVSQAGTQDLDGAIPSMAFEVGNQIIWDGATFDMFDSSSTLSDAQIKVAYENNADTNAFTDAMQTKLTGVEALADVTDATNVTAAGALMASGLLDEDSMVSDSATAPASQQSVKAYTDALAVTVANAYSSTSVGEGASLVGVEDAAGDFTGTNLEAVLIELAAAVNAAPKKVILTGQTLAAETWELITHNMGTTPYVIQMIDDSGELYGNIETKTYTANTVQIKRKGSGSGETNAQIIFIG